MEDMLQYIQDILDLVEYCNGPSTSEWGSKRAAAGHPEPFNLEYIGIGNEDHITPEFEARFKMIYEAVKDKYPEITVVGTAGPGEAGKDYEEGWKIARKLGVPVVDEHYYKGWGWFLENSIATIVILVEVQRCTLRNMPRGEAHWRTRWPRRST